MTPEPVRAAEERYREAEEHVGIRFLEWLLAEARYERDEAERKLAWSLSVAEPEEEQ